MIIDFVIKAGAREPQLTARLEDSDGPVDLHGAAVALRMRRLSSGDVKIDSAAAVVVEDNPEELSTPEACNVAYLWAEADTDTPGIYEAEFLVTYDDGRKQRFPQDERRPYIVIEIQKAL